MNCEKNVAVYIRVTGRRILPWIQKVTETTPLLLVAGGNSRSTNGPDIEVISGKDNRHCSKSVKPYFGRSFIDEVGEIEHEGDALGMTGQFVKQAPIVCGGKNGSCLWERRLLDH